MGEHLWDEDNETQETEIEIEPEEEVISSDNTDPEEDD